MGLLPELSTSGLGTIAWAILITTIIAICIILLKSGWMKFMERLLTTTDGLRKTGFWLAGFIIASLCFWFSIPLATSLSSSPARIKSIADMFMLIGFLLYTFLFIILYKRFELQFNWVGKKMKTTFDHKTKKTVPKPASNPNEVNNFSLYVAGSAFLLAILFIILGVF